jgi:hypothetical protein
MHGALREYRFFVVNDRGEVKSLSFALCEDDVEAVETAASCAAMDDQVEIWDVGRLVSKLRAGALN